MDEPLAAIDRSRRAEILPFLDRLRSEMEIPIVYVSHSVEEIARIADMMVVLEDGKVAHAGPTAEILSRLDLAALGGDEPGVILTGEITSIDTARGVATIDHAAGRMIAPAPSLPVGAKARIRVHARDVAIAIGEPGRISIRNRLPGTITEISPRGGGVDIRLDLGGEALLARLTADAVEDLDLTVGAKVTALIKAVAVEGY
jgi:molybdate transport system ATP-binding protein